VFTCRENSQLTVTDIELNSLVTPEQIRAQYDAEVKWMSVLESLHSDKMYHPSRHYKVIREIGKGSFGHVNLAEHKEIQVIYT
jgi:serine/threonine protein kinase